MHPPFPQAATELVENAIVHNDADTPRIAIDIDELDGGERGTVFRLEDNGPGIPDDEVRIRDLDTESQLEHSLGFGLWLVRWVVTASNAELSFETDGGRGTTVRIHFAD